MEIQIGLFDEIEKDEAFQKKKQTYEKWLTLPDKILIKEVSAERQTVRGELGANYTTLYQNVYHECDKIPDDGTYIWLNCVSWDHGEYWVIAKRGIAQSEHIRECPFCGARLAEQKGDVTLYKAEARYWLFYLNFDIPMHEGRKQTPEERENIRQEWG